MAQLPQTKMMRALSMNAKDNMKGKLLAAVNKFLQHFPNMHGELAVSIGDDIIYHENFTYVDAPWTVNKNAQYLIASITKQFTSIV